MLQNALAHALRLSVVTTNEMAQIVVDNTVGRVLDTNPRRVR